MRFLMPFFLAFVPVALTPTAHAVAGPFGRAGGTWGAGSCAATASVEATPKAVYEWVNLGNSEQAQLMLGAVHCGTYWVSTGRYYPRRGDGWGDPCACPTHPPVGAKSDDGTTKGKKIPFTSRNLPDSGRSDKLMARVDCDCCDKCECGDSCECSNSVGCSDNCKCGTALVAADDIPNFGVDQKRINHEPQGRYTINGREITAAQAHEAIVNAGYGTLPDDAKLMRMTLIGSKTDTGKVLSDLASDSNLAALKDKVLVQSYLYPDPATDSMLKHCGFVCEGSPSIYLQTPDGKVRHRQAAYDGPAKLAEAIRKADPTYDPAKDPDLTKPAPAPAPAPLTGGSPTTWILAALGGFIALLLGKK